MPQATPSFQDRGHPEGFDYEAGSPHLRHSSIRRWVTDTITDEVRRQIDRNGRARVLEIGAGHGSFTDHVLAVGGLATVTEMSRASAEYLRARYAGNKSAEIFFDRDGDLAEIRDRHFDVVLCVSVLHHIPDYVAALRQLASQIAVGGSLLTFQDPLWRPRLTRRAVLVDRGAFYVWRLGQGDLLEGMRSFRRRARDELDEANPRDMVEYHAIRQGCDEVEIATALRRDFATVEVVPYWSTPSPVLQRWGTRLGLESTFASLATDRRDA